MDKTIEHQTTKATMKRRSTQHPLTRVDVWHLENVLFKLYRTIQSCVETVDSVSLGLFDLHAFVIFLHNLNDTLQGCLSSIPYLEMLRDFRYEIYKWACFYANRIGSTIDQEMGSRKDVTYLIAENLDSLHIKYRGQDRRPVTITDITDEEAAFDLSDYFIARYDKSRILRIYKHISVLAYEQSDLYISKIISIIAYAHYQGFLSCSYARTIRAADIIKNWIRNRYTIEFLGTWEMIHNPGFKVVEFDHFRKQAGLPSFVLSASAWIERTNAIGIVVRKGRYGGTFAYKDIAFEFGTAISVPWHR